MEVEDPRHATNLRNVPDLPSGGYVSAVQWEVLSYFAILNVAMGLGSPQGIASIPISYFLKDSLHLSPVLFAVFIAIVSTPVCLGFMFGFIRDRWRSARWGDRQYLLAGAIVAAGIYLWLAASTIDYFKLLSLVLVAVVVYVMIFAAAQALMTGVAQSYRMTGRLSVVFGIGYLTPAVLSALVGGWLVAHMSVRNTFLIAAGVTLVIGLQAFWRLEAAIEFENVPARTEAGFAALRRLIRHRPLWPAAVIFFLCGTSVRDGARRCSIT